MEEIKKLKSLHGEILDLFDKISLLLRAEKITRNVVTIRSLLSSLKVYVKILFSIEERTLFPILLGNRNEAEKSKAISFVSDMEKMKETYYKYNEKWVKIDLIQKDPNNFIKETRKIFDEFFGVFTEEKRFIRSISRAEEQREKVVN